MAKQKKKKIAAKKTAPRKAKSARKVSAKKSRASAHPRETLLGRNHSVRKLNPFTRKQKEKLLNLRDVGQADPACASGSYPVRPIHCRMPIAARETEQNVARPPIGHFALRFDR